MSQKEELVALQLASATRMDPDSPIGRWWPGGANALFLSDVLQTSSIEGTTLPSAVTSQGAIECAHEQLVDT